MFSTIAIIISLFLLMYFAYRGYSVLILPEFDIRKDKKKKSNMLK